MKKSLILVPIIITIILISLTSCKNNYSNKETNESLNSNLDKGSNTTELVDKESKAAVADKSTQNSIEIENAAKQNEVSSLDYSKVKPDESGQIMVVMFHNFVEAYPKGTNEYTTTFGEFEKLLSELYEKKYRVISLTDMLNNKVNVPAGCIPIVFTFDDGTAGQFNLIESNGKLAANPKSAVGIMEAFNQKHSDFGLEGTFYVNLGVKSTFKGEGALADRLNYLINKGFEIGNHTKTHISLPGVKTPKEMQEEIGGNQKLMNEIVPGYNFNSFSLPFGGASKNLKEYVVQGNYEGVEYKHSAIMLVGANPSTSPISVKFNSMAIPRVRATGMNKVECDLAWWLETLAKGNSQYISDGNENTVTVPLAKQQNVDMSKLNGKQLITY